MKHLFLILSLLFLTTSLFAQSDRQTDPYEIMRKRLRVVDDPIFSNGDTLYMLYDLTDSLQWSGGGLLYWYHRGLTEEEKSYGEVDHILLGRITLYLRKDRDFKTLTCDELKNIPLTSREEYVNFYEREYKRLGGKLYIGNSYMPMDFSGFNPFYYFKKVYIIVPEEDGTFKMHVCTDIALIIV